MIGAILAGLLWIVPVETVPVAAQPTCQEALNAQDEVVSLLDKQVAALRQALEEKTSEAGARAKEAEVWHKLYTMEVEENSRLQKRSFWSDKMAGMKWGLFGFSLGAIADRAAR